MRLFELVGYKNHPIYQAGKGLRPYTGRGMSGHTYDEGSMAYLIDVMREHGWWRIGKGSFANVFRHDDYPYVVKIFYDDGAYAEYFKIMKANQSNPYVPKIRGGLIKLNDKAFAVRLEDLKEIKTYEDPMFKAYVDPRLDPVFGNIFDNPDNAEFLKEHHPQLVELIDIVFSTIEGWNDLTLKNVLRRGNTLIVADPIGR